MENKVFLLAGLVLFLGLVIVAEAAYVRPVKVTGNVSAGEKIIINVPSSYLDGFQGLYVSDTSSCTDQLPTWYKSYGSYVLIAWDPGSGFNGSKYFYLCYGDIYYQPENLWIYLNDTTLTATVHTPVEEARSTATTNYYAYGQRDYPIVVYDFGEKAHVINATISFRVYSYGGSSMTVEIRDDAGHTLWARTYPPYYAQDTVTVYDFDTSRIIVVVNGVYLFQLTGYDIFYQRYQYNETNTTFTGHRAWLVSASGQTGYVKTGNVKLVIDNGAVNGTDYGQPLEIALTPVGVGIWGQSAVGFLVGYESDENLTLAATVYGYDASSEMGYSVYFMDTPANYSYVILGESEVAISGGGGGTGGGGNVTVYVSTEKLSQTWAMLGGYSLAAIGITLIVVAILTTHTLLVVAGMAFGTGAVYLLDYAGDYKIAYLFILLYLGLGLIAVIEIFGTRVIRALWR